MRLTVKLALLALLLLYGLDREISVFANFNVTYSISSSGNIRYPEHEIGFWCVDFEWQEIKEEADYVFAMRAEYVAPRPDLKVIFVPFQIHPPTPGIDQWANSFITEQDLQEVEIALKAVDMSKFKGITFFEEHITEHVTFNDDVNLVWFGETLLGYPLYLNEAPSASEQEWREEMYFRMVRGFYNYFHELGVDVGTTGSASELINQEGGRSWRPGVEYYWGLKAFDFIKGNYDFVVFYIYTVDLDDFVWTKEYFDFIDQHFSNQKKFWILTRIWSWSEGAWEPEAIALEMKNCLDRNMVITTYLGANPDPPLDEIWAYILDSIDLYDAEAPYYENYVEGRNLLSNYVGYTYGWVDTG